MNQEAKHELRELAQDLTYGYIKHSGLFRSLESADWDSTAEVLADKVLVFLEGSVNREIEAIQLESEVEEAIA